VTADLARASAVARKAAQKKEWATVESCATAMLSADAASAEGHFLAGLAAKGTGRSAKAVAAFERALELSPERYDAAVELANLHAWAERNNAALGLLEKYETHLTNSPRYLHLAAATYSRMGLPERAWPLYANANELQPGIDLFQADLAACGVFLGKVEEAKALYERLLEKHPAHQRNHYELARLEKANDATHVEQMEKILQSTNLAPDRNVFLYYALGKELEDLERWDEAFRYYKMAGDAAASVAKYDVAADIELIDKVIEVCSAAWLARAAPASAPSVAASPSEKTPIFIVGLPRTGTTLTERILSSHSQIESVGETLFMQMVLRLEGGIERVERMTPAIIESVARKDMGAIAARYLEAVEYRFGSKPMFIEKYPENFLYLGVIAKAFPAARLVHLRRNAMDTCFAMYKQSYFRYAYRLDDLAQYYVAYERLARHWRAVLGERLIEVGYEALVADQEGQTRKLLGALGLDFEDACLRFDENPTASATASAVQIRERMHTRSIDRWRHFEKHLEPLRKRLLAAGIAV
jgi:tetratricopeptide (TPR) repeat protein